MNSFLLFLLKSTLSLSLLYLVFSLLMRKDTFFKLNRLMVLFMVLSSVVIPFLYSPQLFQPIVQDKLVPIFQNTTIIEEPVQQADSPKSAQLLLPVKETIQPATLSVSTIFIFVYLLGVFVSFLLLCYSISAVLLLFSKARKTYKDGIRLMIVPDDIPAFSFSRYILISQYDYEANSEAIIAHEQSHIRMGHFYDLILMELVKIVFWFNPLVYRMVRDLKEIHEFQADQHTLTSGIDATKYQILIIQKSVGHQKFALANSFNHCQIKNRITMMNKQKTSKAWRWKVATFLPLLALLLMAFGRTGENVPPEQNLLSPLVSSVTQDSVKQWAESDFKVFTKKTKEDIFFKGMTFVIVQMDANSKISVDDKNLTLNELPIRLRKWMDYNFAEREEWIHFKKEIINGKTAMSPMTVITIRKDSATQQTDYLKLLNVVANTILQVRDSYSREIFGSAYSIISLSQRKEIDKLIPMNVATTKAVLKKFEIAPPPPSPTFFIEIRSDGNYIENKLCSLEEIGKKAEILYKNNPNGIASIKADSDVEMIRVTEVKEVLRNSKVLNLNYSSTKAKDQIQKKAFPPPPPPPPVISNLGFQITLSGEKIRINRKEYTMDELIKMLNEINPKTEYIKIDTHSTSSKELLENIKSSLEKQNITYQINWSKL